MWKTLSLVGSLRVWFTRFYVRAVMPAMSAKPPAIYPHVCESTWSVIGPLTFSNIYIILHNVALYVLMSVLVASLVTHPQLSNLKSKKLSTCNGGNLHLIINSIMLILNFPCNCIHCSVPHWRLCMINRDDLYKSSLELLIVCARLTLSLLR